MKDHNQYRLKAWELALLCALSLTLSAAVWAQGDERIEDGLIRLHVLAVSDDGEEQQIKLRVRDAVLSFLSPELETVTDKAEAERIVSKSLPQIRAAAESAAEGREVTVTLTRERYPTRRYGSLRCRRGSTTRCASSWERERGTTGGAWSSRPSVSARKARKPFPTPSERRPSDPLRDGHTALRFKLLELWGNLTR